VEYETQIAWEFRKAAGSWVPLDGPVRLMVSANFEHPTTWSRAKRNRTAFCTSKPDHDNILKVVSDALNSLAWKDDQQIVASQIVKHYRTDIPPCLCITVTEA
jgi:Holliday junction resolvase RusA-like endonuclease